MIWAPIASRSRCSAALTDPCVPTGMNAGVCTTPCGVSNSPTRAVPSVEWSVKRKLTPYYSFDEEAASRGSHLRRQVGRARGVDRLGGLDFQAPGSGALRNRPHQN